MFDAHQQQIAALCRPQRAEMDKLIANERLWTIDYPVYRLELDAHGRQVSNQYMTCLFRPYGEAGDERVAGTSEVKVTFYLVHSMQRRFARMLKEQVLLSLLTPAPVQPARIESTERSPDEGETASGMSAPPAGAIDADPKY